MDQDYDNWNIIKKDISKKYFQQYFCTREIWFLSIGKNIGYEQDGKNELFERPVLIYRKFNSSIFLGIPLTSSLKKGKYYFTLNNNGNESSAILSQIRLFDSRRLLRRVRKISPEEFIRLRQKIKDLL